LTGRKVRIQCRISGDQTKKPATSQLRAFSLWSGKAQCQRPEVTSKPLVRPRYFSIKTVLFRIYVNIPPGMTRGKEVRGKAALKCQLGPSESLVLDVS
jgi:hypothetical protein